MARDRGNGNTLLLAAGQHCRLHILLIRDADLFKQFNGHSLCLFLRHPEDGPGTLSDIPECGHMREEIEILEDHPDLCPRCWQIGLGVSCIHSVYDDPS